jgi:uncharacterized membrane protein YhfC
VLLVVHALAALLMLMGPLLVAAALLRRLGGSWRLFWAGGAIFVLSQVVHIPLNALVAGLFTGGVLPMPPESSRPLLLALGLGLSAGLCEELARYIGLRTALKTRRGWAEGVTLGLGHGGSEAMIVGALSLLALVQMITIRQAGLESLGIPPEQLELARQQVEQYWAQPILAPLVAPLERVGAMCAHVGLNVLVMRAAMTGQLRWVLAAILGHTALNTGALLLLPHGAAAAEAWVLLCAAVAVGVVLSLRRELSPPKPIETAVEPLRPQQLTIEESAEKSE